MLGLLFVFATPILKAHDEFYHWYKSYAVSIGHFVPSESSEEGLLYDKLPKIVEDLPNNLGSFWLIDYKKEIKEFINIECKQNEKYGEKDFVSVENIANSLLSFYSDVAPSNWNIYCQKFKFKYNITGSFWKNRKFSIFYIFWILFY